MTKILICGAAGKMGGNVLSLLDGDCEAKAVCGVDRFPKEMEIPVYSTFAQVKEEIDVVVDFSSAENLKERLKFVKERKIGIVLASTGFTERDLKLIDEYAAEVAIFKTANLSLGVNLMQALCRAAAEVLGESFDVADACRHHQRSVRRRKALRRRTKRDRRGARKNGNRNPRRSRRNDRRRTRGDVCGRGRNPHDFPQREKQTGLCGGRRPRGQVSQRKACGKIRNERSPERGKLKKRVSSPYGKRPSFYYLFIYKAAIAPSIRASVLSLPKICIIVHRSGVLASPVTATRSISATSDTLPG